MLSSSLKLSPSIKGRICMGHGQAYDLWFWVHLVNGSQYQTRSHILSFTLQIKMHLLIYFPPRQKIQKQMLTLRLKFNQHLK